MTRSCDVYLFITYFNTRLAAGSAALSGNDQAQIDALLCVTHERNRSGNSLQLTSKYRAYGPAFDAHGHAIERR